MRVFKFGGASVKDAEAVRNIAGIINGSQNLVVVISAMGKITNLMELLLKSYFSNNGKANEFFKQVTAFHNKICNELFEQKGTPNSVLSLYSELESKLKKTPSLDYNFEYDQIVGFGELISTTIVSEYLNSNSLKNRWVDIRACLRTDDTFRDAVVNWQLTEKLMQQTFSFKGENLYITQGFIGSTKSNLTTTLGREGSDFTAAIIGNVLNAEDVSIWKDVPGILNADPKKIPDAEKIEELSYREAVEMAYSGAQVIHPKTMKPLHNKQIPLFVKSFVAPWGSGSVIHHVNHRLQLQPVFITKENQVLITISPIDFSFITVDDINDVIKILHQYRIKINLIQQSAIDFNLVVDFPETDLNGVLNLLSKNYIARYNTDLTLHTIRHFNDSVIQKIKEKKKIYLEQNSRRTARLLTNA